MRVFALDLNDTTTRIVLISRSSPTELTFLMNINKVAANREKRLERK